MGYMGQNADGTRGLFPANHVEEMTREDGLAWMNGDATKTESTQFSADAQAKVATKEEKKKKKKKDKKVKVIQNFTLNSLSAFDDLIDKGYCMEGKNGTQLEKSNGPFPQSGDPAYLSYTAYLWDGQKQIAAEIQSSDDDGQLFFIMDGQGEEKDDTII